MDNWQQENSINNEESHDANVTVEEGQDKQNENLNDNLDALLADDSDENAVSHDTDNNDTDENEKSEESQKSEQEEEEELRAAIAEEELDDATDAIAESLDDDEEFLETNNWDYIADLIRFVVKIKQSDDTHVKTVSSLFYESAKQLKPLALAEAIDLSLAEGQDERTQMIEFMLRDVVSKSNTALTDMAAIRASIMELAQWAYNIPDEDKKHVSQAAAAIVEHFPKKVEKVDQDGNVERDDENNPVLVNVEYAPKRTTKNTTGDEIVVILDELHANIDAERVKEFMTWYDSIISAFVGEQE